MICGGRLGEGTMKYLSFAKSKYLEGFLFGTSVSGLLLLIFIILTDAHVRNSVIQHFPEMITTLGSLIAAYIAIKGVSHQIQANIEIENSRRQSQFVASRASLPLALSQLHDACRGAIAFTYKMDRSTERAAEDATAFIMPEAALLILKECISYSDVQSASRLANVIRHYQVVYSRTITSYEESKVSQSPFTNTLDWGVVVLLIEDCDGFARGNSSNIPIKIDDASLHSVFSRFLHDIDFWNDQGFMDALKRRISEGELEFFIEAANE